jgi:hypothetical protein
LGGFDLVLGIWWLHTLGSIVWDFDALFMAFWYRGRAYSWTNLGNKALAAHAIVDPCTILEELLLSYADILEEPRGLPPCRAMTTAYTLSLAPHRSLCDPTTTHSSSRTRLSVSATTCYNKGSSGSRLCHSPPRCSLFTSMMAVGASMSTIELSMTAPSRTSFLFW